jgi:pyruvate dehydrogenase E1 component
VLKVIWGDDWDPLLARDTDGWLVGVMNETVDGQYQKYSVEGGAYIREGLLRPLPGARWWMVAPTRSCPTSGAAVTTR